MTSGTWLDDIGYDAAEYDDSELGEAYDDSEPDAESPSDDRRRRAQIAQLRGRAMARRRVMARAAQRGRLPAPRPTSPRAAVAAIRNLDLETKVQEDRFRSASAVTNRRMSRSEYAAVAGAAVNQFIESFEAPDNPFFRAALRFSPLLLLSPQPRGTGFEAFVKDPRVIGGAAVAAITLVGENRNRFATAGSIDVLAPDSVATGADDRFLADVFDRAGRRIDGDVVWSTDDAKIAIIDEKTGKVTGVAAGVAVITARFGNVQRRIRLVVT
jgi:hypothetical protein